MKRAVRLRYQKRSARSFIWHPKGNDCMAQSKEQARWSHYYQTLVGRPPRPLLIEALTYCGDRAAVATTRWAADVGCGDGMETLALLQAGWHVLAIDQQPEAIRLVQMKVAPELQPRLLTRVTAFEQLDLPAVDFAYAGFSLPFCTPQHFSRLWATIVAALAPGGCLPVSCLASTIAGQRTQT